MSRRRSKIPPPSPFALLAAIILLIAAIMRAHGQPTVPAAPAKILRAGELVKPATVQMQGAKASYVAAKPVVVNFMADFAPTAISNLTAFIAVSTNFPPSNWIRFSLPYAPGGGTFAIPWTNAPGSRAVFRAGWQFP